MADNGTNGEDGRDPHSGRFRPGHGFSRGPRRPRAPRAAFTEELSENELRQLARRLYTVAMSEDVPAALTAAGLLCKHLVGVPPRAEEPGLLIQLLDRAPSDVGPAESWEP